MSDYYSIIGGRMKHYRTRRQLRQSDVANAIGTTHQTIYKYETGQLRIPTHKAVKICGVIGMPINALITEQSTEDK